MTSPADLASRALAARTALLALCDALVSAADASHAGLAVPPPAPTPAPECPTCESPKRTDHRMVGNINDRYFCRDKWHAPTPAPEAKRPTHVRVTRLAHSDRPATVGKVYEVVRWNDDGSPDVIGDNGSNMSLSKPDGSDEKVWPAWEPAPCPPPVAGSAVGIPRRIDISRQTPIEAAIRAARDAVEAGPAHPHMTRASALLGQALDAVADFVDGVPEKPARIIAYPYLGNSQHLTYGKEYDVIRWDDSDAEPRRYPVVVSDLGVEYRLTESQWEAAK